MSDTMETDKLANAKSQGQAQFDSIKEMVEALRAAEKGDDSYGEKKRGWVTGTTGWRPSLMILLRRNSSGSSWLVSSKDKIARVLDHGPR